LLVNTNLWSITTVPSIVSPTSNPPTSDTVQVFGITLPIPILVAIITVIIVAAVAPLVLYKTRRKRKKKHRR
jgi:tellurite resistance protein TehA-like permease